MEQDIQTALGEITGSVKSIATDLAAKHNTLAERQANFATQLDNIRAGLMRPPEGGGAPDAPGFTGYTTPGQQFIEKADFELLKKTGGVRLRLNQLHPAMEHKTLVDSAALGYASPGPLGSQRIEPSIIPLPRRRLVVRDLLRSKPITASQIDWIQELTLVSGASPQTEGSAKGESENTFQVASEKVRCIAAWQPVTRQAVDDLPELRRFIDESLIWQLKVEEEWNLLFGDGSGDFLHGIFHQAPSYAGAYAAGGDTVLDVLRHVILELAMKDEQTTGFILNPKDVHDAELVKTAAGGAGTGSYIAGDPLGGVLQVRTLWGVPVVSSPVMPVGSFLAGQFSNAIIGDRMPVEIALSESHADYFTKNKLAIRCEERLSLAVLRATSFLKGTL
jgi:HK97 family phage major capsid protein